MTKPVKKHKKTVPKQKEESPLLYLGTCFLEIFAQVYVGVCTLFCTLYIIITLLNNVNSCIQKNYIQNKHSYQKTVERS